jgi:hypothetical protein
MLLVELFEEGGYFCFVVVCFEIDLSLEPYRDMSITEDTVLEPALRCGMHLHEFAFLTIIILIKNYSPGTFGMEAYLARSFPTLNDCACL